MTTTTRPPVTGPEVRAALDRLERELSATQTALRELYLQAEDAPHCHPVNAYIVDRANSAHAMAVTQRHYLTRTQAAALQGQEAWRNE